MIKIYNLLFAAFWLLTSTQLTDAQTCIECSTNIPLNNGLVFCAPMNGNASDVTSSPVTPNVNGAALTTDRFNNPNGAFDFSNVSTSKINYTVSSKLNSSANQSITMSAWFYIRSTHAYGSLIMRLKGTDESAYYLYVGGTGHGTNNKKIIFDDYYQPSLSLKAGLNSSSDVSLNSWHHVAITINKATNQNSLYYDGMLVDTTTAMNSIISGGGEITIGNHPVNPWGINGKVDDARIYSRTLSQDEVFLLYNEGKVEIINPDTSIFLGDSVQIQLRGTASSYSWSPATGVSDTSIGNPILKPIVTTQYILTSSNGICINTDTITITVDSLTSGIKPENTKLYLTISPNPSSNGIFNYSYSQPNVSNELRITLFNQLGQLIATEKYTTGKSHIDISSLNHGLYFVAFTHPDTGEKKIVKIAYW